MLLIHDQLLSSTGNLKHDPVKIDVDKTSDPVLHQRPEIL